MTKDVQDAMLLLYQKQNSLKKRDIRMLERIDKALDYLTNNPEKVGDPRALAKSAMGSAVKVLANRNKYNGMIETVENSAISSDELEHLSIELVNFIEKSSVKPKDKEILVALYIGKHVAELAMQFHITEKLMRVWISRARKRMYYLWNKL